jgi:signal transduction histidine kinase
MNKPLKILIADDVQANVLILSRLLQRDGYQILSAEDGITAYNMAISQMPDLILLDIIMPGMDGYEVCRALKEEKVTSEIPIIFVTARTDTNDKIKGLDMGGVDYITKPFISAEVLARVRTHLTLKTMQDEKLKYHRELLKAQTMASITTLAGGIAHNINNLMGTVIGYADMLQDSIDHDEKAHRYIDRILEASQGVADLTSDLLAYARAGRSAATSRIDIKELLERIVELYRLSGKYHVDLRIPNDPPEIWADQEQITQAISNIYVNAQEAVSDGGTVTVTVSTGQLPSDHSSGNWESETSDYIIISISDTGPGMDGETAQKVFEPFFTTKQTVGAGLGLSASYGIIQKHEGVVLVDTVPGEGSTFCIYLQIMQDRVTVASSSGSILR